MNESQRAVAQVRVRVLHKDIALCVSQAHDVDRAAAGSQPPHARLLPY